MDIELRSPYLKALYSAGFFLSLHINLVIFIHSNFLNQFVPEEVVGLFFSAGAFFTLLAFFWIPKLLRVIGNYTLLVMILLLEGVAIFGLAFSPNVYTLLLFFIGYSIFHSLMFYHMDIFLEHYTSKEDTGEVRGIYMTIGAAALIVAPLIVGLILEQTNDYWKVYSLGSLLLIPPLFIILSRFRNFKDKGYRSLKFLETVKCVLPNKDIFSIVMVQLTLRMIYSWSIIYMPVYLHTHVGLPWSDIGIILTIAMAPFLLFEVPLGRIADDILGEKEMLIGGLLVLAFFTFMISFITTTSILIWAAVLFMSRVGASAVEIMSETHFFRRIEDEDGNTISIFRMIQPFAHFITPIIGVVALLLMPLQYTFVLFGLIVLCGIPFAIKICDSR